MYQPAIIWKLFFWGFLWIFKNLFLFIRRIIALQYCAGFCQTSTWISHSINMSPPSWNSPRFPLHLTPLGCHRGPVWSLWKWKWKWSRSVVSDSSRPHGLQPTRLLHPWDFPGKSTGVGCHCLLRRGPRGGGQVPNLAHPRAEILH